MIQLAAGQSLPNQRVGGTSNSKVPDLIQTMMKNFSRINSPVDALSTIEGVQSMIGQFSPKANSPNCSGGKLRFNGDCVIQSEIPPIYDECRPNCQFDALRSRCLCTETVEAKWECPQYIERQNLSPIDFVVTLAKNNRESTKVEVRPMNGGDSLPRKLPKSMKIVKMCLDFDVGLNKPVCGPEYPFLENDICYKEVLYPPKVNCIHLADTVKESVFNLDQVNYHCKKSTDWVINDELDCTCSWEESIPAGFKCPKPFSRWDHRGDFYSIDDMRSMAKLATDFPLKLCYTKEYLSVPCGDHRMKSKGLKPSRLPQLTFGEWHTSGFGCARELWHPPTERVCPEDGTEPQDGFCTRVNTEGGIGRCEKFTPDVRFDYGTQMCRRTEYSEPVEYSCDHVFNAPVPEWGATPIVQKERDGATCSVTRYIPAINKCATEECTQEVMEVPLPRCPEGKLVGKGANAVCFLKTVHSRRGT